MKKIYNYMLLSILILTGYNASSQILISAMMPNVAGTDSAYEYVQLIATQNIDFATTPYSLVMLNNGAATLKGWAQGTAISYKFNLTSGTVHTGDVFYVGGNKMKIDGVGSTDLSGLIWIRVINNVTTGGDGLGNLNTTGVFGNVGGSADGAGVFLGTTIDSTTIPVDALFFGATIGTAYAAGPPIKGYQVPNSDHYTTAQGFFGAGTNTYSALCRNLQDTLLSFTGTYDTTLNTWAVPRVATYIKLTTASLISAINTNITLIGTLVGMNDSEPLKNIEIYPNPSDGVFNISNPKITSIDVEVYDLLGNSIYRVLKTDKNIGIDLSRNAKGVYFVRIADQSGNKVVKKLVIK
ncbi:MAG: T9SS type A sorting domain-containing protein [Bacillota bacterium]